MQTTIWGLGFYRIIFTLACIWVSRRLHAPGRMSDKSGDRVEVGLLEVLNPKP